MTCNQGREGGGVYPIFVGLHIPYFVASIYVELPVLQCVRNVWELVTTIHHRLRTIVSLVKMSCNVQCNVQLITDGHYFASENITLSYAAYIIYNIIIILYNMHNMDIATEIKYLMSFISGFYIPIYRHYQFGL